MSLVFDRFLSGVDKHNSTLSKQPSKIAPFVGMFSHGNKPVLDYVAGARRSQITWCFILTSAFAEGDILLCNAVQTARSYRFGANEHVMCICI